MKKRKKNVDKLVKFAEKEKYVILGNINNLMRIKENVLRWSNG